MTLNSRRFLADVLCTIAERHPEYTVEIKLRHLPGENTRHKHVEDFPYPWVLDKYFPHAPKNVIMSARSTADALDDAAFAITCTSTAAMDAISRNVPTLVYLNYPENYLDPLTRAMRLEFMDSGLIARLPDIMELKAQAPNEAWMDDRFRGDDLFEEIEQVARAFRAR